jgi:hypothetical protein
MTVEAPAPVEETATETPEAPEALQGEDKELADDKKPGTFPQEPEGDRAQAR